MGISRLQEFWPGWSVTDVLGEGSYGKVYKAVKSEGGFETFAAIKVVTVPSSPAEVKALRAEGMTEAETKTYFQGVVADFINEIKLMENLKGASNIVAVEDYKILEKTDTMGWDIFIRMELLQSFDSYLANNKPSVEDVIRIGIDLCTGLEICNKYHIIHRDIKPANIFVSKFGDYKLGDFGIAKELEKTSSAMSSKGTYSYMAPEVAHGLRYDSTVDIYSLGIVLYTLLNNNRQPFVDPYAEAVSYNDRKNAADKRLDGGVLPPPCNASPELASVILCACSYSPAGRFKTPTAFKNALTACKNGTVPVIIPNNGGGNTEEADPWDNPEEYVTEVISKDRLRELYTNPKEKEEGNNKNTGKNIAIVLALIAVIGFLAVCFTVFLPKLLDSQQQQDDKEAELESQLENLADAGKVIRIDIEESAYELPADPVEDEGYGVDSWVNVYENSGECWLFVEIITNDAFDILYDFAPAEDWYYLEGHDDVIYMKVEDSKEVQSFFIFRDNKVYGSDADTVGMALGSIYLNYNAYALHTSQAADPVDAWAEITASEHYEKSN